MINGTADAVRSFIYQAFGRIGETVSPLSLHALVPEPDLLEEPELLFLGYEWRKMHWGTPQEVDAAELLDWEDDDDSAEYEFSTAWSPPVAWVLRISERMPELEFGLVFAELGERAGEMYCAGGVIQQEYCTRDPAQYREFVRREFPGDPGML